MFVSTCSRFFTDRADRADDKLFELSDGKPTDLSFLLLHVLCCCCCFRWGGGGRGALVHGSCFGSVVIIVLFVVPTWVSFAQWECMVTALQVFCPSVHLW